MSKLPDDLDLVTENSIILALFGYRCVLCGRIAQCVHEIIPRSQAPKTWAEFQNRVPLCNQCHDKIHHNGAVLFVEILRKKRLEVLRWRHGDH